MCERDRYILLGGLIVLKLMCSRARVRNRIASSCAVCARRRITEIMGRFAIRDCINNYICARNKRVYIYNELLLRIQTPDKLSFIFLRLFTRSITTLLFLSTIVSDFACIFPFRIIP